MAHEQEDQFAFQPRTLLSCRATAGGPKVKKPTRQGFGTQAVNALVLNQLRGEIRYHWRAEGVACAITIPTGPQNLH
jgi:two-component sensor histidine kinase